MEEKPRKRRTIWRVVISIILVVAVVAIAGIAYAAHFASIVAQSQRHKASGAIRVTETAISTSDAAHLQTFGIVSDQSTASYSVYEDLIFENKPNNDAIGTTHAVTGNFQIRTGASPLVTGMNIQVDLRTLQSDSSRRDNYIQQNTLETDTYPYATFVSVSAKGLPSSYSDGQDVHFLLLGNLTLHGQTNAETFDVQGKVVGNTITGTASSTIYMTDFGMQPPNLANIAISQNKVDITLMFMAQH
jgi:polyisoprenoid-binding protein YceI